MSDLTTTSTSNTITLTWTEPDLIPSNGYSVTRQCRRLCEESFDDFMENTSSSPPLMFSGINPGSYCKITSLVGIYGSADPAITFDSGIVVITLSVGEFDKCCYEFYNSSLLLFSQNLALLQRTFFSLQLRLGLSISHGMMYLVLDRMDPSLDTYSTTQIQHSLTLSTSLEERTDHTLSLN